MLSNAMIIVAHFVAQDGKIAEARDRLLAMIAPTRAEPGCVEYRLHQDQSAAAEFTFFEVFADRAAWDAHMQTDTVRNLLADISQFFVGMPQIRLMSKID